MITPSACWSGAGDMACTDVAKVKAKATVINRIIFSSNVNFQIFVLKSRLSPQRQYKLTPHNQTGPDDAAAFWMRPVCIS